MRVLIVFDHPYTRAASENTPHNRSFAAALAAAIERGLARSCHDVDVIDLHADGFNPVMSAADLSAWRMKSVLDPQVHDYQRRLFAAEHVVFVFPIWWEAMPAMTKGFFDRVLTKGIVYDEPRFRRPFVNRLTGLRGVSVVSVMSTPALIYRWWFGSPLTKIVFRGTFRKIGVGNLRWINVSGPGEQTLTRRERTLRTIEERFAGLR